MAWILPVASAIGGLIAGNAQNKANNAAADNHYNTAINAVNTQRNQALGAFNTFNSQHPNPASTWSPIQGPPQLGAQAGPQQFGGGMLGHDGMPVPQAPQFGGGPGGPGGFPPGLIAALLAHFQNNGGGGQQMVGGMPTPVGGQPQITPPTQTPDPQSAIDGGQSFGDYRRMAIKRPPDGEMPQGGGSLRMMA